MKRRRGDCGWAALALLALDSTRWVDGFGVVVSPGPRTTFSSHLRYSSTDDDEDGGIVIRRQLHEHMQQVDPDWYQEYVVDVLGEEHVKQNWPAVLQYTLLNDQEDEEESTSDSSNESTTTTSSAESTVAPVVEEKESAMVDATMLLEDQAEIGSSSEPTATGIEKSLAGSVATATNKTEEPSNGEPLQRDEKGVDAQKSTTASKKKERGKIFSGLFL